MNILFDSPDDEGQLEGFRRCAPEGVGALALNLGERALAVEVTGTPCIESPPIRVAASEVPGMRLRMRQHQGPRGGVLWWTTEETPEFSDERRVAFDTTGGGTWDDLHLGPGWAGVITRLRLQPVADPGDGSPWVDFAEVRLVPDAPPPEETGGGGEGGPDGPISDGGDLPDPEEFGDGGVQDPENPGESPRRRRDGGPEAEPTGATLSGGCQATGRGGYPLLVLGLLALRRRR